MSKTHPKLSIRRQCMLLSLTRSTFYYTPVGETPANLTLMRLIDQQTTTIPESTKKCGVLLANSAF